jgi:uncharacterized membrane protein YphA (DoxX/SURF4 family)
MSCCSKIFFVLLRLAIGWHFFIEGVSKLNTYQAEAPPIDPPREVTRTIYGQPPDHPVLPVPTAKSKKPKKPWSSEVYLREANGPLAGLFHWMAGDPLLDRLEVLPAEDQPADRLYRRLPHGLDKDWRAYFDAFVAHYKIEGNQLERLEAHFKQRKAETVRWLLSGARIVVKAPVAGNAILEVEEMTPERIQKYKDLKEKVRKLESMDAVADFHPRLAGELEEAKADLAKQRAELQKDVDDQTAEMKAALIDVTFIEPHKVRFGFLALLALPHMGGGVDAAFLVPAYQAREKTFVVVDAKPPRPMPEPAIRHMSDWDWLDWIDFLTRWGLAVIGGMLLLGLFTRTACVGGALFLLMFYLAMPPFPGLPVNPRAEGHYLYINKNTIEMLALLALATTRSGRWLGLDALLRFLCPSAWRARTPAPGEQADPRKLEAARPSAQGSHPRGPSRVEHDPFKPISLALPESKMKEPPHGH